MKLRTLLFTAVLLLPAAGAYAQAAMPEQKTFASSAEVQALLAKAKTMPPKPMIVQDLVSVAPYPVHLEFRNGTQKADSHPKEAELIYVVDGAGTINMGGTIANGVITGGTSTHVAKGDFVFVPPNTPHQMTPDSGGEAQVSIHVPAEPPAK